MDEPTREEEREILNLYQRERDKLVELAWELIDQLHEVENSPEYFAVWWTAHTHNGPYRGPTYIDQRLALEQLLDNIAPRPELNEAFPPEDES